MAGALFAAHLSGWAYRNVDDHMGRARRDLLGQDRGNELAFGIDVQLALDAHELVVSGTEVDGAAPGDAASLLFDHALQRGKVQVHRGTRLHRVGGSSRDRKSVVSGKSVSGRVALGGRRLITNKKQHSNHEN